MGQMIDRSAMLSSGQWTAILTGMLERLYVDTGVDVFSFAFFYNSLTEHHTFNINLILLAACCFTKYHVFSKLPSQLELIFCPIQ